MSSDQEHAHMTASNDCTLIRSVEVVMASYNRREHTLKSLRHILRQTFAFPVRLHVVLLEDNSTDGTREAIAAEFPFVEILRGTGDLFWCGGMRVAFERAMSYDPDYYLFLNDDTTLEPDAVGRILSTARELENRGKRVLVAGSTFDPDAQCCSYGGYFFLRGVINRKFVPIAPNHLKPQRADTMNGNCVLIPRSIVRVLGNLEQVYVQQYGDYDYGLRATRAGYEVWLTPGYVGTCINNRMQGSWRDPHASFRTRWKNLVSNKGVPWRQWLFFTRRHFGYMWPFYCVSPYLKTIFRYGLGKGSRL